MVGSAEAAALDAAGCRARKAEAKRVRCLVGRAVSLGMVGLVAAVGGACDVAVGLWNDRFWHLSQEPCEINVIEAKGDDYMLVSINDTCHLGVMGNALAFLPKLPAIYLTRRNQRLTSSINSCTYGA